MTTRETILDAAVKQARRGLHTVTVRAVAEAAGVSRPTVYSYFPSAETLRDAAAFAGVERGDAAVIARLTLDKHRAVASQ
jgi:AcrR family transcriptional regulator